MNIIDRAKEQAKELYGNIPCNYKIATRNGYHYESITPIKWMNLDSGQCITFTANERKTVVVINMDAIETVSIIPQL